MAKNEWQDIGCLGKKVPVESQPKTLHSCPEDAD